MMHHPRDLIAHFPQGQVADRKVSLGGSAKRFADIVLAGLGLLALLPLIALTALLIRLIDGGPVIIRHRRIGLNGVAFDCLKFRTMVRNAPEILDQLLKSDPDAAAEWAASQKLRNDPRITALGGHLRRSSIDELPQLWNILRGDMSIVGPRPMVSGEIQRCGDAARTILKARPGLTGPWQIEGRNDLPFEKRIVLNKRYVETWSFWQDVKIILKTVPVVLTRKGSC